MRTPLISAANPVPATRRLNDPGDVAAAMRDLVDSAQPAVVFTSLAALCVSAFSDECSVFIEEAGRVGYRIDRLRNDPTLDSPPAPHPGGPQGRAESGAVVRTSVRSLPMPGERDYRGVVVHRWHDGHRPTDTDIALARMVVDRAVDAVHQERLVNRGRRPQRTTPVSFATAAGNRQRAVVLPSESRQRLSHPHRYPACTSVFPLPDAPADGGW